MSSARSERSCAPLPWKPTPLGTRVRADVRGQYADRRGIVVSVNDEQRSGQVFHREYGVAWKRNVNDLTKANADSWFLPHELMVK